MVETRIRKVVPYAILACAMFAMLAFFMPTQAHAATNGVDRYRIIYHLAGGTQADSQINDIKADKAIKASKLKKPTKRGYKFSGWYTDKRYTKKAAVLQGVRDKSMRSVYAKWTLQTYKIRYKVKGGTLPSGTKYLYITKKGKSRLATPKRLGYTFEGWFADKAFKQKVTSIPRWSVGAKTLYAKWKKNIYTITYDVNGGTLPTQRLATYTVTTSTTALPIPKRSGYSFMGWKQTNVAKTRWLVQKGSVGNLVLKAQWRKRLYIAHRGYYAEAEQNSIGAFRAAKARGFDGVEADVRFTKDDIPVLRHNTDIAIEAMRNDGDGSLNIVMPLSLLTLKKLQAVLFNSAISGENGNNVTTFEELLAECQKNKMVAVVHLKEGTKAQVQKAVKLANSYHMLDNIYWASSDSTMLQYVKQFDSNADLVYGPDNVNSSTLGEVAKLKQGGSDVLLSVNSSRISKQTLELCRDAGVPISAWDLNDERAISSLDQYVSMYMLDGVSGTLPA